MTETRMLPEAFSDLEPLAADGWCLATEIERSAKRHGSSPASLKRFYDLFAPRIEDVISYLDDPSVTGLLELDENLKNLLFAMAEVSFSVEKLGADESSYRGLPSDRFVPVHELRDGGLPVPEHYRDL